MSRLTNLEDRVLQLEQRERIDGHKIEALTEHWQYWEAKANRLLKALVEIREASLAYTNSGAAHALRDLLDSALTQEGYK